MRDQIENLVERMLDGQIFLNEAIYEFEKIYIQKALDRCDGHHSNTANMLGIHRNTLTKKVANYHETAKPPKRLNTRRTK